MDDIFEFVGDFLKCMVSLAMIVGILWAIGWGIATIFGIENMRDEYSDLEFKAQCESVGGIRSMSNCYKDGEIVFSKEQK